MSDIICVQSETSGRLVRVRAGELALQMGDRCVIESELGGDLAVVVDETSTYCHNPKAAKMAVSVIRKATPDDIRKFEWLREKESRGLRPLPPADHRPQPAHEARRGALFLQREKGHLLLYGRRPDRFPPAGQGPGQGAPDADRDAPGRRPGRGQDDRRARRLRPLSLLFELHDDLRAGDHPEGPETADRHQPDQDLGAVRPADVLPGVRGADARGGCIPRPTIA